MNEVIEQTVKKHLNNTQIGELSPGQTGRRYEPEEGVKNLNKRIHRESEYVDKYKKLPYSFSKPKKDKPYVLKRCVNCKNIVTVSKNAVGVICSACHTFSSVEELVVEK